MKQCSSLQLDILTSFSYLSSSPFLTQVFELIQEARKMKVEVDKDHYYKKIITGGFLLFLLVCGMLVGLVVVGIELTKEMRVSNGNSLESKRGTTLTSSVGSMASSRRLGKKGRQLEHDLLFPVPHDGHDGPIVVPPRKDCIAAKTCIQCSQNELYDKTAYCEHGDFWRPEHGCGATSQCFFDAKKIYRFDQFSTEAMAQMQDPDTAVGGLNSHSIQPALFQVKGSGCLADNLLSATQTLILRKHMYQPGEPLPGDTTDDPLAGAPGNLGEMPDSLGPATIKLPVLGRTPGADSMSFTFETACGNFVLIGRDTLVLPWIKGDWPTGAQSCSDAVAKRNGGASLSRIASTKDNVQSIYNPLTGTGDVDIVLEIGEIQASLDINVQTEKCLNTKSTSNFKGQHTEDEFIVEYTDLIKCDKQSAEMNPGCVEHEFATGAKYRAEHYEMYHIRNDLNEMMAVTISQITTLLPTDDNYISVEVRNLKLGKILKYNVEQGDFMHFKSIIRALDRNSVEPTSFVEAQENAGKAAMMAPSADGSSADWSNVNFPSDTNDATADGSNVRRLAKMSPLHRRLTATFDPKNTQSMAKDCKSKANIQNLIDPAMEIGNGDTILYADESARRRLNHQAHRARRMGAMNSKHHRFTSFDATLMTKAAHNHYKRHPEKKRQHLWKKKRRRLAQDQHQQALRALHYYRQLEAKETNLAQQEQLRVETYQAKVMKAMQAQQKETQNKQKSMHVRKCGDFMMNGEESDIDCGGTFCRQRCAVGQKCRTDFDCEDHGMHCDSDTLSCSRVELSQNLEDQQHFDLELAPLNKLTTPKNSHRRRTEAIEATDTFAKAIAKMGHRAVIGKPLTKHNRNKNPGYGKPKIAGVYRIGVVISSWKEVAEQGLQPKLVDMKQGFADKLDEYIQWISFGTYTAHVDFYYHSNTNKEYGEVYNSKTFNWEQVCSAQEKTYVNGHNREYKKMVFTDEAGKINKEIKYEEDNYDIHFRMVWGGSKIDGTCVGPAGNQYNKASMTVNRNLLSETFPVTAPFAMDTFQKVFIHEVVHAMGIKPHQNRLQCDPGHKKEEWRNCYVKEYGNPFDLLGRSMSGKMYGMSSFARWRLGFIQNDDIAVVDKALPSYETITLAPIGYAANTVSEVVRNAKKMALITPSSSKLYCMPFITVEYRAAVTGFDAHMDGIANPTLGSLEQPTGGLMLQQFGTQLIDASPGNNGFNTWTVHLKNVGVTELENALVTKGGFTGRLITAVQNSYTIYIKSTVFVNALAGAAVIQGASRCTLKTALVGNVGEGHDVKTIVLHCASGVDFDQSTALSIQDNGAPIVVQLHSWVTPVVDAAGQPVFDEKGAPEETTHAPVRHQGINVVSIKAAHGQVFGTEATPLMIGTTEVKSDDISTARDYCAVCDPLVETNMGGCERARNQKCADWRQVLLVPGSEWSDVKSGLRIHTVELDKLTGLIQFKVDWTAPTNCVRNAPFIKEWMRGHYYQIDLAKGALVGPDYINNENELAADTIFTGSEGGDLYNRVPASYTGIESVQATYGVYTSFYHDAMYPTIFSVGVQQFKNLDEVTCTPSQMSFRLLGIFSADTNKPVCGWAFQEKGLERASCGQGLGGSALNLGIPAGTPPGAYRVFVRGFHWNKDQSVEQSTSGLGIKVDHAADISMDPSYVYERQAYDEVMSNSWEYIICVDQYNDWSQTIGQASCGKKTDDEKQQEKNSDGTTPIEYDSFKTIVPQVWTADHLLQVQNTPCTTLENNLNPRVPYSYPPEKGKTRNINWDPIHQRVSLTHLSVSLLTRFQGPTGGYATPPLQRCNIYAKDQAAPTIAQVLDGTVAGCGGCVVDPLAASKPFVSIAHHGDAPINEFDNAYPGELRVVFAKVLTPATSYRAYCAQQGNSGMGVIDFTTLPAPTATPIVLSNINDKTFDLTATFNTNNPVVCDLFQKNSGKIQKSDLLASGGEAQGYAAAGVPFTLTFNYQEHHLVQPGGSYHVACAQGASRNGAAMGNGYLNIATGEHVTYESIETWDDVVVFPIVEFNVPVPPPCERLVGKVSTNQGSFRLYNIRRSRFESALVPVPVESDSYKQTFAENTHGSGVDFARVDLYRAKFTNYDTFACQNNDRNYKMELLSIRFDGAPPANDNNNENEKEADNKPNMDAPDDPNYHRRDLLGPQSDINDWKVVPSMDGENAAVAVGVPTSALPGLYRIYLAVRHNHIANTCVDHVQSNQIELYVCVCSSDDKACHESNENGGSNARQVESNPEPYTGEQVFENGKWVNCLASDDLCWERNRKTIKYLPGTYDMYTQFTCNGVAVAPLTVAVPPNQLNTGVGASCKTCEVGSDSEQCASCAPYSDAVKSIDNVCASCNKGDMLDPLVSFFCCKFFVLVSSGAMFWAVSFVSLTCELLLFS